MSSFLSVELGATDLVNLLEEVTPNWFMFGQDLDIPPFILEGFKDSKGVDWCFSGMLNAWLNLGAYWEDLVEALIRIGNRKLANHIENTYIKAIPGMYLFLYRISFVPRPSYLPHNQGVGTHSIQTQTDIR